ncbi:hypothetical protein [Paenibacillus silvae]|uniref:Uncharacterized protein n=1 Tax=Paenibacillus silvae TaxID=1325358 RepID=A0A2W6NEJ0_9BACL|nr:hypothetical protein [Paenibacillus silvae]PZT54382.1 hypothetical protein DN757_17805 [Paenibacillus silvae]
MKKWNINYAGFNKSIGKVKMPGNYSNTVATGNNKITHLQKNQIQMSLREFFSYETSNERVYTLYSKWNAGDGAVKLPAHNYWLQADSGALCEVVLI